MEFIRYPHIKRYGDVGVEDINIGECYVFPKIDGTNSCIFKNDEGEICFCSKNRILTLDNDNGNFMKSMINDERIIKYLDKHPNHRLFGEWLIPHSLETYRADAWNKFYIFDVAVDRVFDEALNLTVLEFIPYEIYKPWVEEFNLDYIMPIGIVRYGNYENFTHLLDKNTFLIKNGHGIGEGIVIKNYDFYAYGVQQTWAKIVTSEFQEKHYKTMGCPEFEAKLFEFKLVDEYITKAYVEKEMSKICVLRNSEWQRNFIPILFNNVFRELIQEETYNIVKKYNSPTINFKVLNTLLINKIKGLKPELFT